MATGITIRRNSLTIEKPARPAGAVEPEGHNPAGSRLKLKGKWGIDTDGAGRKRNLE